MMVRVLAAVAALLTCSTTAFAQSPTPTPEDAAPAPTPEEKKDKPTVTTGATKLKVGGVIFANYQYDMTEYDDPAKTGKNGFDVGRAYVILQPSFGDTLDARITLDLARETGGVLTVGTSDVPTQSNLTGSEIMRVKHAYITNHLTPFLDLTVGMQPTPYAEFEEGVWGHRFINRIAAEEFYGVETTDFGFNTKLKLMGGRLENSTSVQNGESYKKPEKNKYKEIATRTTFTVIPAEKDGGLKVTAYYGYGLKAQDIDKTRAALLVTYQTKAFTVAANYMMTQDRDEDDGKEHTGGGPSIFGFYNFPLSAPGIVGGSVLLRADMVDPDADVEEDGVTRLIAGVGFKGHEKSQVMFNLQMYSFESSDLKPLTLVGANWEAKF